MSKRTLEYTRWFPKGTRVTINDHMRMNVHGTVVDSASERDRYGSPTHALVQTDVRRMLSGGAIGGNNYSIPYWALEAACTTK